MYQLTLSGNVPDSTSDAEAALAGLLKGDIVALVDTYGITAAVFVGSNGQSVDLLAKNPFQDLDDALVTAAAAAANLSEQAIADPTVTALLSALQAADNAAEALDPTLILGQPPAATVPPLPAPVQSDPNAVATLSALPDATFAGLPVVEQKEADKSTGIDGVNVAL